MPVTSGPVAEPYQQDRRHQEPLTPGPIDNATPARFSVDANGTVLDRTAPPGSDDLFRSMRDAGGVPEIGPSARTLVVRRNEIAVGEDGLVRPLTGGVSVSPGNPTNLPSHRRPPEFGGNGRDPVWCLSSCDLPQGLTYRPDPDNPTGHGFIEPSRPMTLGEFETLLEQTQSAWIRIGGS